MKRLAFVTAAIAAAAFVTPAFAGPPATHTAPPAAAAAAAPVKAKEHSSAGIVAAYAADTHLLKLKSGTEFKLASNVMTKPKQGERVTVRWTMQGKERIADRVTVSP